MAESIGSGNVQTHILDNPEVLGCLSEDSLRALALSEREAHKGDLAASGEVLAVRDATVATLQASILAMGAKLSEKDAQMADLKTKADEERQALAIAHEVNRLNERISRYQVHAESMIVEIESIINSGKRFDTLVLSKLATPIGQMRAYVKDLEIDTNLFRISGFSNNPEINPLQQRLMGANYRFKDALNDMQVVSGAEGILPNMLARIFSNEFTERDLELLYAAQDSLRNVLPPKTEDDAVNG